MDSWSYVALGLAILALLSAASAHTRLTNLQKRGVLVFSNQELPPEVYDMLVENQELREVLQIFVRIWDEAGTYSIVERELALGRARRVLGLPERSPDAN
jgi:hypothetical protein